MRSVYFRKLIPAVALCFLLLPAVISAGETGSINDAGLKPLVIEHFGELCNHAARVLKVPTPTREIHETPESDRDYYMFFVDSYAVRALNVAWDLTGNPDYFDSCVKWCDRVVACQKGMIPAGAYYIGYHRKPGENTGEWYLADSGSIAMAILATALRVQDEAKQQEYLESVKSFLDMVIENFVRPSGGVTDGFWNESDKEWWCSTALFSSIAFQYYGVTGENKYLEAATNAFEWLKSYEYDDTILYKFEDGAPTTVFYFMESQFSALPYLSPENRKTALARITKSVEWMADTQEQSGTWNYNPDNWGVKLGGLPCMMLQWLRVADENPDSKTLRIALTGRTVTLKELVRISADKALDHFSTRELGTQFIQRYAFTMMSLAEYLAPGELYHKTSSQFPYPKLD